MKIPLVSIPVSTVQRFYQPPSPENLWNKEVNHVSSTDIVLLESQFEYIAQRELLT